MLREKLRSGEYKKSHNEVCEVFGDVGGEVQYRGIINNRVDTRLNDQYPG